LLVEHSKDWTVTVSGPAIGPTLRLRRGGHGNFVHLTEKGREKEPGNFKELHQGTAVVGPCC